MVVWHLRLALLLSLLIASSASAVTMAWTPIGNPGNACELYQGQGCFGAVSVSYKIGTYEVTNVQYAEFLNAKAASDPLGLYNPSMGNTLPSVGSGGYGGIARSGSSGNYTYSAIPGRENMPVNHVSFFDALRFANWMNNGQGNGDTETGAYTLLGGTPMPSNGVTVQRNVDAAAFLPTEDEWYKAAYYNPATSNYFDYPARSNLETTCSVPPGGTNHANCSSEVPDLTPVGSYSGSASPYGTYDQGGNLFELNETRITGTQRGMRGGSFFSPAFVTGADYRTWADSTMGEYDLVGFRLAMVPEPSTGLLVIAGLLGLAVRRRMLD